MRTGRSARLRRGCIKGERHSGPRRDARGQGPHRWNDSGECSGGDQEGKRGSKKTKDVSERMMLQEALDDAAKPDYRQILEYPYERSRA